MLGSCKSPPHIGFQSVADWVLFLSSLGAFVDDKRQDSLCFLSAMGWQMISNL